MTYDECYTGDCMDIIDAIELLFEGAHVRCTSWDEGEYLKCPEKDCPIIFSFINDEDERKEMKWTPTVEDILGEWTFYTCRDDY